MNRVEIIQALAELYELAARQEALEARLLIELPVAEDDEHPSIPDPPSWVGLA